MAEMTKHMRQHAATIARVWASQQGTAQMLVDAADRLDAVKAYVTERLQQLRDNSRRATESGYPPNAYDAQIEEFEQMQEELPWLR